MGYNQGKGIGAKTPGSSQAGFYGGYEGGFNNDLPLFNGKIGINGEDSPALGFGEARFDPEWGDHEENTGDWDVSWDSAVANAKPPLESFIPKDVVDEPIKTSIPQVPSTEKAMKSLDLIFEERDKKGLEYWKKMNDYIISQRDKIRNDFSWSQKGGQFGVDQINNLVNKLKANCQQFKSYINKVQNRATAKKKRTQSVVNGFKAKLKELTKTDNFSLNFNVPTSTQESGLDGGSTRSWNADGGTSSKNSNTNSGVNTNSDTGTTTTSTLSTITSNEINKCIKDVIDSDGGNSGKETKNPQETFKQYFENRFDQLGKVDFGFTTDSIKGRKSAICSTGITGVGCNSVLQLIPSPNIAENIIMIKNKSYYDFDLNIDVLFRQGTKAGIGFRMRDQYNYYAFMIDVKARLKELIKVTDGRVKVLRKIEDGGIILNDWHSIHISTTYSNIKIFIYDAESIDKKSSEKIIEYHDNSFVEGQIGIIVDTSEGFCFDKLTVQSKVVWTPWVPKKNVTIVQSTSGVFNEGKKIFIII